MLTAQNRTMKLKILTTQFWKSILGSKNPSSKVSEKLPEPKHMPQNHHQISTTQHNETRPSETEEPQKLEKEESASAEQETTEEIEFAEHQSSNKAGRPINEPVHFTILRIIKRLEMIF